MSVDDLILREATESDTATLLAAHAAVFGAGTPERPERTLAGLRWRWLQNPAAGGGAFAAFDGAGKVVAGAGGLPRRMRFAGRDSAFLLLIDAFVLPGTRLGLANPGPFEAVAKELFSACGGLADGLAPVCFGWPTRAAHRIGKERLGLEVVRNQNRLVVATGDLQPGPLGDRAVTVEEVTVFPEEMGVFSERAGGAYGAIAVRDQEFLSWRFLANPEREYRIALAREAGRLLGYAVYRGGELDGLEGGLVADWLVDPEAPAAGCALRGWLRDVAAEESAPRIQAVLPEFCPDFVAFQRDGFRVEPTSFFLAARSWSRRQDMLWLYWNWYYTLADFDRS